MSLEWMRGLLRNRALQHGLFWLFAAVVITTGLAASYQGRPFAPSALAARVVLHVAVYAAAVYLNLWVLIPRYFDRRRYVVYGVLLAALLAAASWTIVGSYTWLLSGLLPSAAGPPAGAPAGAPSGGPAGAFRPRAGPPSGLATRLFIVFYVYGAVFVLVSSLMHFIKAWIVLREAALQHEELERQKLQAELLALRAQLNPHFLFNSLNNIYALSLEGSDRVPAFIIKLSDLVRYILYECRGPSVPLAKELAFIGDYLDLERIRIAGSVDVRFETLGTVDGQRVAPLLFVPLIENAFKHGVKTQVEDAYVHLTLDVREDDRLTFRIANSRRREPAAVAPYGGVGLPNLRKRLELLYPERHALAVRERTGTFEVELHLDLSPTAEA